MYTSEQLLKAAETSLVDYSIKSNEGLRAKLVFNVENKRTVLHNLEKELSKCEDFWFSVAFITKGGLQDLKGSLRELENYKKSVKGRLLTSNYLFFNKPDVFEELLKIKNIEVRISEDTNYHAKGYCFLKDGIKTLYVGSSNLTDGALKKNKEWNLKLSSFENGEIVIETENEFENIWNNAAKLTKSWIKKYKKEYTKKNREIEKTREKIEEEKPVSANDMQRNALDNLESLRKDGNDKALIISATGTGKTYLSAFDVKEVKPRKMLFLVHREQILKQATKSFKRIVGDEKSIGFLTGNIKDLESDYLFSTVQTMKKKEYRESFSPEEFDYIIIDETHRAGASSYKKILDYFKPKFLLGMTATPERTDGFNIFELFNNKIAHEVRLKDALEKDLLCPFHYYGIKEIEIQGKEIDDNASIKMLTAKERVKNIIEQAEYYGYSGKRVKGLVFCSRKEEAIILSNLFNKRGYQTKYILGSTPQEERDEAVTRLESDDIDNPLDYLFTVDVFNEGIDIPEVNQIIMLRGTQSSIVFVQQLGRGLRKSDSKEYVVVLDFIGNYKNNFMIPVALSGDNSYDKEKIRKYTVEANNIIPGASTVYFDRISREKIYESIDKANHFKTIIKKQYKLLKQKYNEIPYMEDFLKKNSIDPLLIIKEYGSYNKFLKTVENEYKINFTKKENDTLEYLSSTILKGVRPSELLILKEKLDDGNADYASIKRKSKKLDYILNEEEYENAKRVLQGKYVRNEEDELKYTVVEKTLSDFCSRINNFNNSIRRAEFERQIKDIIEVGLAKYSSNYKENNGVNKFVVYKQYTRKDVCFLMNSERNLSGVMFGKYELKGESFIFVTYKKRETVNDQYEAGKADYADGFITPKTFGWESKVDQKEDSDYVKALIGSKKRHLFVQKAEGQQFFYLGTFEIDKSSIRPGEKTDRNNKKHETTKMDFLMNEAIEEELIEYFESDTDKEYDEYIKSSGGNNKKR